MEIKFSINNQVGSIVAKFQANQGQDVDWRKADNLEAIYFTRGWLSCKVRLPLIYLNC